MKPKKKPDLEIEVVEDELIVLDADNQKVHKLNGTAAAVFMSCDGDQSVEQITQWLARESGMPLDRVQEDVSEVVGVFIEQGLISA